MKAGVLAKIIIEAAILCENAGLFVDTVTCDGASWNRSMWRSFGTKRYGTVSVYKPNLSGIPLVEIFRLLKPAA